MIHFHIRVNLRQIHSSWTVGGWASNCEQSNQFIFGFLFVVNIQIKKTQQGNLLLLLVPSSKPLAASLPTVATASDPLCLRWAPQPFFDAHQTISPGHAHRVHHVYHSHFTHHALFAHLTHHALLAHRSHVPIWHLFNLTSKTSANTEPPFIRLSIR